MRLSRPDPTRWNATDAEVAAHHPCDDLLAGPVVRVTRAIDVAAPIDHVFRWLCQLRIAPYSYDWVDNLGRRSPERLTPGLDRLAEGQRVLQIFRVVSFVPGEHLTLRGTEPARRLFGDLATTYAVRAVAADHTRLVCRLDTAVPSSRLGLVRQRALLWGDLVMMRRQLIVLRDRAEASPAAP